MTGDTPQHAISQQPGILYRFFLWECLWSLPVFAGWLFSTRTPGACILFATAWLALAAVTGIARFTGNLTRRECGDLRFMWYSLYNKFPRWINWVFGLICVAVLFKPLFGLTVYAAAGLAFYRGYEEPGKQKWKTSIPDSLIRIAAGLVLAGL
jgi:hypothetical protein